MKIYKDKYYFRILKPNNTISDAFLLLNGDFGMAVHVVLDNKLLGIVTAGDLRRCLLRGKSITTLLADVINKDPIYIKINDSLKNKFEIINNSLLDISNQFTIPVINEKNEILGITYLNHLQSIDDENLHRNNAQKILVVGGGGYIGSTLTKLLLDQNYKVKVVDNFLYDLSSLDSLKDNSNLEIIKDDICILNNQINCIKDVDAVVFLAEIVGDPACKLLPEDSIRTNFLAVNSMANLCSYMNISRFIYTSSCSVYGASEDPEEILDESSALNPVSHYARIKLASENSILSLSNTNFNPTILRLGTVFGSSSRLRFDLVVNTFARDAFFKKNIKINGGNQWRTNIHVKDVANGILNVLKSPIDLVGKKIFNLCNENKTILELSKNVEEIFTDCVRNINQESTDKRNYRVSSKKIKEIINFVPKISINDGLLEFKNLFENNISNNFDKTIYSNYNSLYENNR